MANEERKIQYGIKGKLISAIAMLLVAVIMTVSSTYAWFTLSTAPEVTGISTAVGANGALEMLLLTWDATTGTFVYNSGSVTNGADRNTYWGNLVDLSDEAYGSGAIILYPSALSVEGGKVNMNSPLKFPQYGVDGRVDNVNGTTLISGKFNSVQSVFSEGEDYFGFRAIGSASGMTDRQLAHRSAYSNVSTYMNRARNQAESSLQSNGNALAAIAVQKVMMPDPEYSEEDKAVIGRMIEQLQDALDYIDEAYQQAILAWAASGLDGMDRIDDLYNDVKAIVEDNDAYGDVNEVVVAVNTAIADNVQSLIDAAAAAGVTLPEGFTLALPTEITAGIAKYNTTLTNVGTAASKFDEIPALEGEKTTYSFSDFDDALTPLVNMSAIKINGYTLDQKEQIAGSAMGGSINVQMPTGGGAYADIADQCGNYRVGIQIDSEAMTGMALGMIDAYMETQTSVSPLYLDGAVAKAKAAKPAGTSDEVKPFTEFYGYLVDLAFRTNAAQSNLLLQQKGIDRIYQDNNNEDTMGHGSTMTFASDSNSFSTDKIKDLMEHIRIVFIDPQYGTIYASAKLDAANGTVSNGGVTATMYLYETVEAYEYAFEKTVYKKADDGKFYYDEAFTKLVPDKYTVTATEDATEGTIKTTHIFRVETGTKTIEANPEAGTEATTVKLYSFYTDKYTQDETTLVAADVEDGSTNYGAYTEKYVKDHEVVKEDGIITSLTQNQPKNISALVYLDGETIENADVAADVAQTMSGTANFQFASDANLKPMEYGDLYTPNAPEANP